MDLFKIAHSFLKQASLRLKDAQEAEVSGHIAYAIRLSQEAVELSLKSALKAKGIEYPKIHDVSIVLIKVKERFPNWFKEEIPYLAETSKVLAKKRELSLYGEEDELKPPEELFTKQEAEEAVKAAQKTNKLCKKLIRNLKPPT